MTHTTDAPRPRGRFATAGITIGVFVAILWGVEIIDSMTRGSLEQLGVRPLSFEGLRGILFGPLLHSTWGHLLANTGPLLVLGFIILLSGVRHWAMATAIIWVVNGIGTWIIGGIGTTHIGASGIVFGWTVFLILRGFFARNILQIVLGIVVLLAYGGVLWGVFPTDALISWQSHLFGAIGGGLAAWFLNPRRAQAEVEAS